MASAPGACDIARSDLNGSGRKERALSLTKTWRPNSGGKEMMSPWEPCGRAWEREYGPQK